MNTIQYNKTLLQITTSQPYNFKCFKKNREFLPLFMRAFKNVSDLVHYKKALLLLQVIGEAYKLKYLLNESFQNLSTVRRCKSLSSPISSELSSFYKGYIKAIYTNIQNLKFFKLDFIYINYSCFLEYKISQFPFA